MKMTLFLSTLATVLLITPAAMAGDRHNGGVQPRRGNANRTATSVRPASFGARQGGVARRFTPARNWNGNFRGNRVWAQNRNFHNWNGNHAWNGNWNRWHNWRGHRGSRVVFIGSYGWPWWGYPYSYGYGYPYYSDYGYSYGYSPNTYDSNGYYSNGDDSNDARDNTYDDSNAAPDQGYPYDSNNSGPTNNYVARNGPVAARNGSVVIEVQRGLSREGYYKGTIDGQMGSRTRYAIRAYKRAHNLRADMAIDQPLLRELRIGEVARR